MAQWNTGQMLITFVLIILLNNALATDPHSLNTGHIVNAASTGLISFVAQTQRLLSNFDPSEFMTSMREWPQKEKIEAIQNAIRQGHLNALGGQTEFIRSIGRWPSSLKMSVVKQAMNEGNK